MKKISLPELRDYCELHSFRKIIFSSDNQTQHSIDSSIHMNFEFDTITITFNPNIIYLRNRTNSLRLNRVKEVKVSEKHSLLGEIFTIICGDASGKEKDKEYTLVAR